MTPDTFWRHVARKAGCWPWLGPVSHDGHGTLRWGSRHSEGAHRVAYLLTRGEIPAGAVIRHLCDNPTCCNPAHLAAGTHADNVADRVRAGRSARGERHGRHKLSLADVAEIRRRLAVGERPGRIAQDYPVTRRAIEYIRDGVNWRGE